MCLERTCIENEGTATGDACVLPEAPWLDQALFPEAQLRQGCYGLWRAGVVEPTTLDGIEDALREEQEKPKKAAGVGFIEVPGHDRLLTRFELPELRGIVLEQSDRALSKVIRQKGWITWILLPLVGLGSILGLPLWVLAIQAMGAGQEWWEAVLDRRLLRQTPDVFLANQVARVRFGYWVGSGPWKELWRAYGLAVVFLIVYLLQLWIGLEVSVAKAALVKPRVWEGQVWRLLSALLMHGPVVHILMNCFSWLTLATVVERIASRHLVIPLFVATGLCGNLFSLFLLPEMPSLGASGGILGLLGFLTAAGIKRKDVLPPGYGRDLIRSALGLVVIGLFAWKIIDNAAHFGGYLAGGGAGLWMFRSEGGALPLSRDIKHQRMEWLAILMIAITLGLLVVRLGPWGSSLPAGASALRT